MKYRYRVTEGYDRDGSRVWNVVYPKITPSEAIRGLKPTRWCVVTVFHSRASARFTAKLLNGLHDPSRNLGRRDS